jgi:hypothetical protein
LRGFTLDTGALIALERGEERVIAMLDRALTTPDATVNIPAGVLAQAFRDGSRQVSLTRLLKDHRTSVVALDHVLARVVGILLGARGGSDVVDASVVICARRYRQPAVTSDPEDLRRLDPDLPLEVI